MPAVPNAAQRWSHDHVEAILRLIDEALGPEPPPPARRRTVDVEARERLRDTA